MKYRPFGRLDWQVSALGFGCMRLPILDGKPEVIDEPLATRMLHDGIDMGINYVDTAYAYHDGQSELFLGRALQNGYRQKVRLATKMPTWLVQTYADFDRLLDEQLAKLQTDHIDFYLLHALSKTRWLHLSQLNVCEWAEKAIASGRIGYLGFSFHDDYPAFKQIIDDTDSWTFCQIQYNYMDISEQAGLSGLQYAASKGLAVVVMEPLLGGKLADPPDVIRTILEESPIKHSPADWALQWVWDQPEVTLALSGMSTMQHVEENLASADRAAVGSFTPADQAIISRTRDKYREICPVPCTRCRYCMPCPNGVNIPYIFEIFNKGAMLDMWSSARFRYGNVPEGERASACIDCGACEEKCPQAIPISDWMPYIQDILATEKAYDGRLTPLI